MTISIIIPTYNEAENLTKLLPLLKQYSQNKVDEVIVADGGSTDETKMIALEEGAIFLPASQKRRAVQMNEAAKQATGQVLYFVHADALPPKTYVEDILNSIQEGFPIGCYRFRFDSDSYLLKINSYCTRFDRIMCRGGDQTLFVTRELFFELRGYRNDYLIMEDFDFILRAQKKANFKIIPKDVIVSARKYRNNNYFKVNLANMIVFMLYFLGCSQEKMAGFYKRVLNF